MSWIKRLVKKSLFWWIAGAILYLGLTSLFNGVVHHTSTDEYCMSCHVHTHSDHAWKLSTHVNNKSGVKVHCVDCHLPPKENGYVNHLAKKAKHGFHDLYSFYFKDTSKIDWVVKSQPEIAAKFVYKDGCLKCHANLFPVQLSDKGGEAHLRYDMNPDGKRCITCHINVGHYDPLAHKHNANIGAVVEEGAEVYTGPAKVSGFVKYAEKIPGTNVSFNMMPIPGGVFKMGTPKNEKYRQRDEEPVREVQVDSFWMAEIEVSWDEYLAFFNATGSQGRKEAEVKNENVDAITGATPPWGAPDQGWGKGKRPAITMSHLGAETYCRWLSKVTGKTYRLPTEAEWEYAARANTSGAYFFGGEPQRYMRDGLKNKILGPDTSVINTYVVYEENSPFKTQEPSFVAANPFGLKNMLGNVAEFCLDWYDPMVYGKYPKGVVKNPRGPRTGQEHVVRGGSYKSSANELRAGNRSFTKTKEWLVTDPQIPKSIWWYSDCKHVGFRVVCEKEKQ